VIDKNTVVLQSTLDFMKDEHHLDSRMFLTYDKLIDGKFEEDSVKEEEENPLVTKLPEVKSEYEVCTCSQYQAHSSNIAVSFFLAPLSVTLYLCMENCNLHFFKQILHCGGFLFQINPFLQYISLDVKKL
jgi:hypothetical protein